MSLGTFNGVRLGLNDKLAVYLDGCGCCMWSRLLEDLNVEELQELLSEVEKQKAFVVKELEGRQ